MGFAGYYEDIRDAAEEHEYFRYFSDWNRETTITNKIKEEEPNDAYDAIASDKERVLELIELRNIVSCKLNLALSVENSILNSNLKCIIRSMIYDLENAYELLSETIQEIGSIEKKPSGNVNIINNKKLLVKVLLYKMMDLINNTTMLSKDEMTALKEDAMRLLGWFMDDNKKYCRFSTVDISEEKCEDFIKREMKLNIVRCPFCYGKTIGELRYCVVCAEEL